MLPNRDPFTEAVVVFNDPTLTELAFSYLDEGGAWQDTWETETQNAFRAPSGSASAERRTAAPRRSCP